MKTKEEILGTATQSASHHFENDPEGQLINGGEALTAMQEFADQESEDFAEWFLLNTLIESDGYFTVYMQNGKTKTTAELLNLYKEQHGK